MVRNIIISLAHSLLLLFVSYMLWNIPYSISDAGTSIKKLYIAKNSVKNADSLPEDLVLINISYDRELVSVKDEFGMPRGNIDITDREKLYDLFTYLKSEDDYRYIVCDVLFDNIYNSENDSLLFKLIDSTPRVVLPRSVEDKNYPSILFPKSAIADYRTSYYEDNFRKYEYLTPMGESIALRMAKEIDGVKYSRCGPFYFSNRRFAINSCIIPIETNINTQYDTEGRKNILELGSDVLPVLQSGEKGFFRDKIVIIGDFFEKDIHTTIAGTTAGPLIIYNAYKLLSEGNTTVGFGLFIFIFLLYYSLSWWIFSRSPNLLQKLSGKRAWKHPLIDLFFTWFGYSLLFNIMEVIVFFATGIVIDIWIVAIYFTLISKFIEMYDALKQN